jgi:uncharacterized membrane protein YidH (DUF202 family)
MRTIGIVLIVIGLIFTMVTGFKFFTKEKVVDIGSVEISASKPHRVDWSPYLGVGIIVVGGIVFIAGRKR